MLKILYNIRKMYNSLHTYVYNLLDYKFGLLFEQFNFVQKLINNTLSYIYIYN